MLIGRERELKALEQALQSATQGTGRCCMIAGEAGIGKSRLVQELKRQATQDDFEIVQGSCFQQDASLPYGPWMDALRLLFAPLSGQEIRQTLGPLASEFVKLLPELALIIPEVQPTPALEPAAEKYRAFESVSRFILSGDAPRRSLIILEDLHWSDSLSLELLHFLARRIAHLPVVLIGTYRTEESSSHLERLLADLHREQLVHEIVLRPLNQGEVAQMIRGATGTERRIPAGAVNHLLTLTEGNPLFLEELLKTLMQEGHIDEVFQPSGWEQAPIPRSIQRLVQQRAEQLSETTRKVLIYASIIGERIDFGLLQETSQQNEQTLLHALKELMDAHLIVQESADQFAFRHALTRESIYSMLVYREREAMHRTIAESLERSARARTEATASQLAYHFYQAGVWQKAMDYSGRAGEQAQALYAPREALAHFNHALDAAQYLELAPSFVLLRGRARAHEVLGEFDAARADYENALELARRGTDRATEWQARIDLGLLWQSRDLERAGKYYGEALELARAIDDASLLAESLNRMGNWNMNRGRVDEALPAHREALELFRTLDDRRGMAHTLELLGIVALLLGEFNEGTACLEQAVPILRELDDRQGLVNTLTNLVFRTRFETEVWGGANCLQLAELSEEAVQIARAANWRRGEAGALIQGAGTFGQAGDYSRALDWLSWAESLTEESQSRESFCRLHLTYGTVFMDLLASAEARQHFEKAQAVAQEIGSGLLKLSSTAYLASALILQDDLVRAKELLDMSLPTEYPEGQVLTPVRGLWRGRAELELAQGNPGRALEIVGWMLGSTASLAQYGPHAIPHLSRLRGRALAALGRMEEAEGELQGTIPVARRQGQRSIQWRLHADLGKVYRSLSRRDEGEREFSSARSIIEDLANHVPEGALRQKFLQRALATIPAAHVPTPRQAVKEEFGGLTAREREVAMLISHGKSNREIADELVISEKTAERHVANILLKLGFGSRTQVAVWAAEKGLAK